ncbi:hypothetical protein [Acinetobacter haemolyticus]|uniref:Uncharacterized protein n=1 Tax=Acinetobacter haemolyticus TaxID=29430 RepID=A0A4P7B4V6_ACIHA|nr:hypothetical protein [Acinetobacter haemolyticus]QBQ16271.1 hypothetical protein AHTJR_08255 [Acinetobacter haemolyticus]
MSTLKRIAKNPLGMASLVTNYSRIKELQDRDLSLDEIADIFDQDRTKLQHFTEMADSFVSGENTLSIDVATKSKEAFSTVADALAK